MADSFRKGLEEVGKTLDDELARLVASQARAEREASKPAPRDLSKLSPAARRAAIEAHVRAWLRTVRFEVHVSGTHRPSGLSNQALFDVRSREGRDFLERTVQMDQYVRGRMVEGFRDFAQLPTEAQLEKEHARLVLQWIALRFQKGGNDIKLTALTPAYAAKKKKAGKGSKPIGEWSGAHRKSVINHGELRYK